jgi:hypothetical protein
MNAFDYSQTDPSINSVYLNPFEVVRRNENASRKFTKLKTSTFVCPQWLNHISVIHPARISSSEYNYTDGTMQVVVRRAVRALGVTEHIELVIRQAVS